MVSSPLSSLQALFEMNEGIVLPIYFTATNVIYHIPILDNDVKDYAEEIS